jgi:hypothetical protein
MGVIVSAAMTTWWDLPEATGSRCTHRCRPDQLRNRPAARRSPYTVQDHIKSLLEKTGVSSRQELVARIFLDDYLPRIAAGTPLDSTGQFTAG